MPTTILLIALSFVAQEPAGAVEVAPDTSLGYELEVHEYFKSTGDEPSYWAASSRSRLQRTPDPSGLVTFDFVLEEIAAVLGSQRRTRIDLDLGVDRLVVQQDAATDVVRVGERSQLTDFLNQRLVSLTPWQGRYSVVAPLFDSSVVPGTSAGDADITCKVEPLDLEDRQYTLYQYSAATHRFTLAGATAEVSYNGIAVVDPRLDLPLLMLFEQQGTIEHAGKTSVIEHRYIAALQDVARGEPVLDPPAWLLNRINLFRFHERQPLDPLDPNLSDQELRPTWSVPLWLSGRVADMTMALIAERGTNPLPVTALGSLVLTDQAISYCWARYLAQRQIDLGQDDPEAADTDRVLSPLERAYGPTPFGERLALLGSGTSGVLRIHDQAEEDDSRAVAFGVLSAAGALLLQTEGDPSRLAFATPGSGATSAGMPAWSVVSGSGSLLSPAPLVLAGAGGGGGIAAVVVGGVFAVVAVTGNGGSSSTTPFTTLELNENFSAGCNSGTFELRLVDAVPGRTWVLSGTGTRIGGPTCNVGSPTWSEMSSGRSTGDQVLVLSIPMPAHICIDGTVMVMVDGAPAEFEFAGSPQTGSITNSCF